MSKFKYFLGTQEHDFNLNLGGIRAIQEKQKIGFGELASKLLTSKWAIDDLLETIRFGLIGGGRTPKEADSIVSTLIDLHPLQELTQVATAIVLAAFVGVEKDPVGKLVAEVEALQTDISPSQTSMEQEQSLASPQETLTQ